MFKRSLAILFISTSCLLQAQSILDSELDTGSVYLEYVPEAPYELVEDRIGCMKTTIPLHFNKEVWSFVDYFVNRDREYTQKVLSKVNLYFPIFERKLAEYGLPEELKYLSIVESGLNPRAVSRVGAVGLWQFMPATGRIYGLTCDFFMDERMDPEKSTDAACRYLKYLYGVTGSWELALAAYNAGPGNVRKAIRRSGYKHSFWEIYRYLPRETRSYVPQFVAITYAMNYLKEHNLFPNEETHFVELDTIHLDGFVNIEYLAIGMGLPKDEILNINPELRLPAVFDHVKNYPLKIPASKAPYVRLHREELLDSASKGEERIKEMARKMSNNTYGLAKIRYKVKRGDVLGTIAERYGVRIRDLRSWNRISGNMIRVGQRLNIWVKPSRYKKLAQNLSSKQSPYRASNSNNNSIYYVQPGDTLWNISLKYQGVSVEELKKLNNLKNSRIKIGQKLVIG